MNWLIRTLPIPVLQPAVAARCPMMQLTHHHYAVIIQDDMSLVATSYSSAAVHRVHGIRPLTRGTYVLRCDRHGRAFQPGQYLNVGVAGGLDVREYSIYSAQDEDFFEVLIREIEGGSVSRRLRRMQPDGALTVDGPFGFFTIDAEQRTSERFLFVASGTGISPFRCFVRSYPQLDYRILHGVRYNDECCSLHDFERARYTACVSREEGGDFRGRVTDWLRHNHIPNDMLCYLCGNCDMIYEAFDILKGQGLPPDRLFAEVYF